MSVVLTGWSGATSAGAIAVKIVGNRRPVEKGEFLEFVATMLR